VKVAHGAAFTMDTGKTLGWAGVTPLLGAFGCPKESWGHSSPANREVLCLRSALPVSSEGEEDKMKKDASIKQQCNGPNKSHFRRQRMGNCEPEE
jgi:hypothetical protein